MGDRVLFQVVASFVAKPSEVSPVVYGHWCGSEAPQICAALAKRMETRPGDVPYTGARLVQEVCNATSKGEGALSVGVWNAPEVLTAEDSHGDAGCVLISCTPQGLRFKCMGGYLRATADGTGVTA